MLYLWSYKCCCNILSSVSSALKQSLQKNLKSYIIIVFKAYEKWLCEVRFCVFAGGGSDTVKQDTDSSLSSSNSKKLINNLIRVIYESHWSGFWRTNTFNVKGQIVFNAYNLRTLSCCCGSVVSRWYWADSLSDPSLNKLIDKFIYSVIWSSHSTGLRLQHLCL